MPLVTICLARREPPTSTAQESALIAGVTRLLQDVLSLSAGDVTVRIGEVGAGHSGLTEVNRRLPHSIFTDVDLSRSVFSDVDLRGAVFENTALMGATLRNVDLGAASIADARLEGLTIDGVLLTDLFRVYRERAAG